MPSQEEIKYYNEVINQDRNKIDLVLVTYYRYPLTKKCLDFIFERTHTPYRLTIVDNGSDIQMIEYLIELKLNSRIDNLILLDRNYGLEYARNTALRHIHSSYCVFFDNDLLCPDLKPDWLTQELNLIQKYPEYGCIALRPQIAVGADNSKFNTDKEIVENNHVGATFMMFKTSLLSEVKWDDTFTNRVADWRLGDLFKEKGIKMGWTRDIYCYHMFGKNWSYPDNIQHFHREIWPPAEHYDQIKVDPLTLKPL